MTSDAELVTAPTLFQCAPPSLEYCHTPCVPDEAVLSTITIPASVLPASESENLPEKIVATDWPPGLATVLLTGSNAPAEVKVGA